MKKFVAVFGKQDSRILSVHAETEKKARARVYEQLDRPGRKCILARWLDDGSRVIAD